MTFFELVDKLGRRATARLLSEISASQGGKPVPEPIVRRAYEGATRPSERILDACEAVVIDGKPLDRAATVVEWDRRRTEWKAKQEA